jgi:hypothetical protein
MTRNFSNGHQHVWFPGRFAPLTDAKQAMQGPGSICISVRAAGVTGSVTTIRSSVRSTASICTAALWPRRSRSCAIAFATWLTVTACAGSTGGVIEACARPQMPPSSRLNVDTPSIPVRAPSSLEPRFAWSGRMGTARLHADPRPGRYAAGQAHRSGNDVPRTGRWPATSRLQDPAAPAQH